VVGRVQLDVAAAPAGVVTAQGGGEKRITNGGGGAYAVWGRTACRR
jgi:hypothetical protein